VSPLWPERVRVALCPERVLGARLAFGRVTTKAEMPVEGAAADSLVPLLAALAATRACVAITLSNRFARYFVLPWSAALESEADWQAFAERRFANLYGADAALYLVQVASSEPGTPRVACALERVLLDAIRHRLNAAGHRLVSLRPHFAVAFKRIADGDAWYVNQEPQQLTVGLALGGRWRSLRQRRVGPDWKERLPLILRRESQLAGLSSLTEKVNVAASDDAFKMILH